jgi:hypothetical protein
MIGLGLGPQIVGIISDVLQPRFAQDSLRYSLLICAFVNLWAAWHYYVAGRYLKADLAATARDEARAATPAAA